MVIIYLFSTSYRGSNKRDVINQMDIQKICTKQSI